MTTTVPGFTVYTSGVQYGEISCANDDVDCIISAGEAVNISDVVYAEGSQPSGTPISPAFLPPTLQQTIAECDTEEGCTMIGYDFIQETAEKGAASSYIVSTEATSSTDQGVFYKNSGTSVAYILVTNHGSGYNDSPWVHIEIPTAGVRCVTATAVVASLVDGSITSLRITNPGGGYTNGPPIVRVSHGSAVITATVNSFFEVSGFTIVNGGSYSYTPRPEEAGVSSVDAPTIIIDPPPPVYATQALAEAHVSSAGLVSNIVLTVEGTGYITPPKVFIGPPSTGGQQATAVAVLKSIPVLGTPPGYIYDVLPLTGAHISQTTEKNADACAAVCDANAQCKGFNYDPYLYTCKLFGSDAVKTGPKYVASSSESSYISEKWVNPDEPDTQIGVIKTAPGGTDPPGVDFSNEGAYCPSMPQCNSDIAEVVSSGGIQSFSTADIQSCSTCPIRGFDRASMTVTNEIGTATRATSLDDAISKLEYSMNPDTKPPSPLKPGVYTITKWTSSETMIPSQDIYYSGHGIVNIYNGNLGPNVYFDEGETGDWVDDNTCSADNRYKYHYYPEYTYVRKTYKKDTDKIFLNPVDYVSNGYVLMTSQGYLSTNYTGTVSEHVTCENEDCTDALLTVWCDGNGGASMGAYTYDLKNITLTCPDGGGNSKAAFSRGDKLCKAIVKDVSAKYSARYNNAIFILTPKPTSFNDFWRPYIKENGYIHDSSSDIYYSISLGAPNLSTLKLRLDASATPALHSGKDQIVLTFDDPMTTQLEPGHIFKIPGVAGPCTVISVADRVVTVECMLGGAPNVIPAYTDVEPVLMKRKFSTIYNNLLFSWYQYLYTMDPYTQTYLLEACSLGSEMTDPYADLGLFRTASIGATSFGVTPAVIDDPAILSRLSSLVPGLTAVEYSIDNQNPLLMSVTFSATTTAITLTPTQRNWFPQWTLDRLLTGQFAIDQFELETANGCDPGYGEVTIGHHKYCEACAAGTYSPGGFTTCQPCTSGNYCPHGANNNTTKCAAGYYCSTPASQIQCPAGSFCPEGSTTTTSCDSFNFGPSTKTTRLSAAIPARTGNQNTLTVSLADSTYAQPFYVVTIPGFIAGSMNVITSTLLNIFTPQPNPLIPINTSVTIQTKALSCPVGSSYVSRCPEGMRCPQSSQTLECDEGHYCRDPDDGLGVFIGTRCPADQYYLPLNLTIVQSILYGQENTDGSHCYSCPSGTTVNSSQTGCVCPNAPQKVWSSMKAMCISNCPPGSAPPDNDYNGVCTQCPANKYSDVAGDALCFDCPLNFVSTSTADRTGCTCTNTRHDGSTLSNGTTTFIPRLQRCKVKCNDGYRAFYSNCYVNTFSPPRIPYVEPTNVTLPHFYGTPRDEYGADPNIFYPRIKVTYYCPPGSSTLETRYYQENVTYTFRGKTTTVATWDTGYSKCLWPGADSANWFYGPEKTTCPPCWIPSSAITSLRNAQWFPVSPYPALNTANVNRSIPVCLWTGYPYEGTIYQDGTIEYNYFGPTAQCYPPSCNTDLGDANVDLYTRTPLSPPVIITGQYAHNIPVPVGSGYTNDPGQTAVIDSITPYTPVCTLLDDSHLKAISPSPWGNDGALDNLPDNCSSITDPLCQLPSAVVTLLQTSRLAAEAIR
jgi:hypothetical protein